MIFNLKKYKNFIINILLTLISLLLSYKTAYLLGETYFFDKLFYQKSSQHGYFEDILPPMEQILKNKKVKKRLGDIALLVSLNNDESSRQVLGFQSERAYQVAVIGDSFSYGLGVKEEETAPEILEKRLNAIRKTVVYNLSFPGDSALDNYAKFFLAKKHLNPDLYIIGVMDNDLIFDSYDRYPGQQALYERLKRQCPGEEFRFFWSQTKYKTWEEFASYVYPQSFSEDYVNLCFLTKIVEVIIDNDNVMFFSFSPILSDLEKEVEHVRRHLSLLTKYRSIVEDYGGYFFSPDEHTFKFSRISTKEVHPSKATHRQYAQAWFEEITKNPRWRFSSTGQ